MENNYISFFFNAICGLLGCCLARHAILRTNNGARRTLPWRRETKRRKKDDLFLDEEIKVSLLDLPDLTLDCILEKLSASELCVMTCVCSELREKCVSDHLWEKLMKKKWGRLMGAAATQEWKSHVDAISMGRPSCGSKRRRSSSPVAVNSVMYWYSNLESGKFWFPAQVKQRNPLYVGLGISYYDAKVRYDSKTDTFQARVIKKNYCFTPEEVNVRWQKLRPSLTDEESRVLHVSDCLQGLIPGDCIEIQWRKNKELPYGWWLGHVGHLQYCDRRRNCACFSHENVMLEFRTFKRGSAPWGTIVVYRKFYREGGNEARGFYGGVRKLGRIVDFVPGND